MYILTLSGPTSYNQITTLLAVAKVKLLKHPHTMVNFHIVAHVFVDLNRREFLWLSFKCLIVEIRCHMLIGKFAHTKYAIFMLIAFVTLSFFLVRVTAIYILSIMKLKPQPIKRKYMFPNSIKLDTASSMTI